LHDAVHHHQWFTLNHQCPQTFITLIRLSSLGTEIYQNDLERKSSVHYGLILQVLEYKISVLFLVVSQWTGHKFLSYLLPVDILIKICRPKMLNTSLIFHNVLMDDVTHFNQIFTSPLDDRQPKNWKSATKIWLLLKFKYYSNICVLLNTLSQWSTFLSIQ
jgi:hypothetical protein